MVLTAHDLSATHADSCLGRVLRVPVRVPSRQLVSFRGGLWSVVLVFFEKCREKWRRGFSVRCFRTSAVFAASRS